MVYTELAPRWLQFHEAPAMPALKYTTSVDIQKTSYKKLVTHVESHASAVSLLKRAENMIKSSVYPISVVGAVQYPSVWNSFPRQLKLNQSITAFKINALKTHLFLKPTTPSKVCTLPSLLFRISEDFIVLLATRKQRKRKKNLPPATVNTKPCLGQ